jgi:ABC-type cobalt transport system substrate-binding protein
MNSAALREWARFLDARTDDEAAAQLARLVARLDEIYDALRAAMTPLWTCPSGEVAEALMVSRTCLTEAIGQLETVRARFNGRDREIA